MEDHHLGASIRHHHRKEDPVVHHDTPRSPADPRPRPSLSSSEPTLRFPRPQGNQQLASWISTSQPDIMSSSSPPDLEPAEDLGLSESTYEFVNTTDDESQDGQATESLRSFEDAQPDDIQSLAGTERSGSDMDSDPESDGEGSVEELGRGRAQQDQAESRARASPSDDAEHSLGSLPSRDTASPNRSSVTDYPFSTSTPATSQSIEFIENQGLPAVNPVAVKHTVGVLADEQAAATYKDMKLKLATAPSHLGITVRQIMTQQCLSPTEPLRLLYVGSSAAQHDIVSKIYAALTAFAPENLSGSGKDGEPDAVSDSARGPTEEPEVERTEMPPNQIKVGICTSAKQFHSPGSFFPDIPDYTMTVDGLAYFSIRRPNNVEVVPKLDFPQLAIFYVTEDDDAAAVEMRNAAWKFMDRVRVPCIFISSTQILDRPAREWASVIDERTVHLCLETPPRSGCVLSTKLPVDLATFLNIDSRQMNRSLAYLTQMQQYHPVSKNAEKQPSALSSAGMARKWRDNVLGALHDADRIVYLRAFLVWATLAGIVAVAQNYGNPLTWGSSAVSEVAPSVTPSAAQLIPVESDPTAAINLTSSTTPTVDIPRVNVLPSNAAVVPFTNFIPDIIPETPKDAICSAEIYGRNEILVKIPLSTKTTWLAKDSITIDVLRGGEVVKTKFSSIDEGLLIEIPRAKAYGSISVTIVTSRKPKVNETFGVDFGKGFVEGAFDVANSLVDSITGTTHGANQFILSMTDVVISEVETASSHLAAEYRRWVSGWNPPAIPENLRSSLEVHSRNVRLAAEGLELSLLQAQITSRLWWLRMQGKTQEHEEYRWKAEAFLAKRMASAAKSRKERRGQRSEAACSILGRLWGSSRECSPRDG